jgi:hypothetical protein
VPGFEELNLARADQGRLTGGFRVYPRAQRLRGPSGVFEQFEPPTSRAFKGLLWIAGRQTDKDSRGLARQAASRADTQAVLSRLMPSPQVRSRSVRSSDTRARARVRLVNSRGAPWRHTREGDVKDVWNRAGVEDVIHFARSLDERLPGAVRGGPALVADR